MLENLICSQYSKNFEKNLQDSLVIGKLAATKYEEGMSFGDEKDVIMPGRVTLSDWDGGDLNTAEKVKSSIVKVKVDQGKQVNFEIEYAKAVQMSGGEGEGQAKLASEYTQDALYQFRDAVDTALAKLYPYAGYVIDDGNGGAVEITANNALSLLAYMKTKFSRGHNGSAWKNGKMIAILPPELIAIMLGMTMLQYTESQVKDVQKGVVLEKAGWKIYESNNIYSPSEGVFQPLFGVEGETLASVIQKDMKLIPYMRTESINEAYKGAGMFGVSAPRADLLGTAKISLAVSLASA